MLGTFGKPVVFDDHSVERMALIRSLDMSELWESCSALINRALPCHSCSLLFDIDGFQPHQGRHYLTERRSDDVTPATSLDVAAPYLDAHPRIPWYTFSQIVSHDIQATERLKAQNPAPDWVEFIHLAFWSGSRLEAVLSIRIRHAELSERELSFLMELYPLLDACLQRVRTAESSRRRQEAIETLLYELPIAVILVDQNLAPSYMSREAKRICRRWHEDTEWRGQLPQAIEAPLRRWMASSPCSRTAPDRGISFAVVHHDRPNLRMRLEVNPTPAHGHPHTHHLLILVPDAMNGDIAHFDSVSALPLLKCLSPSERKVAALVAAGLRNDMIAEKLCRSRKTIESQISSIFRKLNVTNRTQLARMLN